MHYYIFIKEDGLERPNFSIDGNNLENYLNWFSLRQVLLDIFHCLMLDEEHNENWFPYGQN
jgi:hypothetical protein